MSDVPLSKREELEEILENALPVLCEIEVLGRAGTRNGRKGSIGIRLLFQAAPDDTAASIADQVIEQIEEHHAEHGPHLYQVNVYAATEESPEAKQVGEVLIKLSGTTDVAGGGSVASAASDLSDVNRHHVRTIKELDNIIVRQGKSMEALTQSIAQVGQLLKPMTEVEIARIQAAERHQDRQREHEESLEQHQTMREVLGPTLQSLTPHIADWIGRSGRPPPPQETETTVPATEPWKDAASLLATLTDDQTAQIRKTVGDPTWAAIQHLADVDNAEAFDAKVADIQGALSFSTILKVREILSEEQATALLGLIQ